MQRVQMTNMEQVKQFVNAANQFPFDITLKNNRYKVNAKSIMGVFSIDTSIPCEVEWSGVVQDDFALQSQLNKQFNSLIEPFKFNSPLIVLIGGSGSGKNTIADKLYEKYGLTNVQSYTTRPQRYENELGHIFVTNEEFDNISSNDIVAYTEFDGNRYCATKQQLAENDVYIIDPTGLINMNKDFCLKEIKTIHITANEDECLKRMITRGNTKEEAWQRIYNDRVEFAKMKDIDIDYMFINNSPEDLNYIVDKIYDIYCGKA